MRHASVSRQVCVCDSAAALLHGHNCLSVHLCSVWPPPSDSLTARFCLPLHTDILHNISPPPSYERSWGKFTLQAHILHTNANSCCAPDILMCLIGVALRFGEWHANGVLFQSLFLFLWFFIALSHACRALYEEIESWVHFFTDQLFSMQVIAIDEKRTRTRVISGDMVEENEREQESLWYTERKRLMQWIATPKYVLGWIAGKNNAK